MNAFLLLQGIETVALRVERHVENARRVAEFLRGDARVATVNYAGFADSPYHALVQKYLGGQACSLLTFDVRGGLSAGVRFYDALKLFKRLVNLGDAKSLACHPASTTHRQMSPQEQLAAGVGPGSIRLSVGIEHIDDILADLDQALAAAAAAGAPADIAPGGSGARAFLTWCRRRAVSERRRARAPRRLAHRGSDRDARPRAPRSGDSDHCNGALCRGARRDGLRRAAAARAAARMDPRAHGAWNRANDESALLRLVQSGREFSFAMRRPHRERLQPAAGELCLIARSGGARKPRDPRRRGPRRLRRRGDGSFRHGRFGGQLHRPGMRAHRGPPALRARGSTHLPGRPGVLHLA